MKVKLSCVAANLPTDDLPVPMNPINARFDMRRWSFMVLNLQSRSRSCTPFLRPFHCKKTAAVDKDEGRARRLCSFKARGSVILEYDKISGETHAKRQNKCAPSQLCQSPLTAKAPPNHHRS